MRFLADSMLGKLATWLRVMGYDTHYQRRYRPGEMERLIVSGERWVLSRNRTVVQRHTNAVLLHSNHVAEQLGELKELALLSPGISAWFSRCLVCNILLQDIEKDDAWGNVPEYVYYTNMNAIRGCPRCERYYWPGSHRKNMLTQLKKWGLPENS